jgi:1-acyl-sn-glycerol-3-phosphate acyltransferase
LAGGRCHAVVRIERGAHADRLSRSAIPKKPARSIAARAGPGRPLSAFEPRGDAALADERDPALYTFARRLVTIPGFVALWALSVLCAPLWIPFGALADALRRGPRGALRCLVFVTFYLHCEVAGILGAAGIWLASLARRPGWRERRLERDYALEVWWARTLFEGGARILGFRLETEGERALAASPLILLLRHASMVDTLLGVMLVQAPFGTRLRYVIKRELLWDPCLDLVGNRTPNYFVRRGSPDSAREIRAVARLARDLGPGEGVLVYPEGTRFTPAKRVRVIERLRAAGDPELLAFAEGLRHVLPPRLGGSLALLDAGVDVVFGAHAGLEQAGSFRDLWHGSLVGRLIRARFWRVPAAEIPPDPEARRRFLFEHWQRVDAWVGEQLAVGASPQPG